MKNIQTKLVILLLIVLALPNLGFSPDNLTNEPKFEVNRIYPYILITKEALNEAKSLTDLSRHFKASWVREYISVEIWTINKGKTIKSLSKNGILSQEQKDRMNRADVGTDISVKVKYIPENTLKHNDPKEHSFTFKVDPDCEAEYPGGQQQLQKYLKEKAIDKIPSSSFKNYDLAAIKFTVGEGGEITDAHIFGADYKTFEDEKIYGMLLEAVSGMPCWKPAEYANGTKVKQEFVLTVGNMENCMINLLNIERDGLPRSAK